MSELTDRQRKALADLGEPWHYRVGWAQKLTPKEYNDLLSRGLIAEAWTWASRTRPDVCITDLGEAERRKTD